MSDENTTPRRVAPEGSVPEDREASAAPDREPDLAPEREAYAAPDREPDLVPGAAADASPVDELPREPAPGLDLEPDRRSDRAEDGDQDRGAVDTQLIEQDLPTTELSSPAPVATPSLAPAYPQGPTTAGPVQAPQPGGLVTVRTGPRSGAIMLGLICLLVSAYTLARQTTDWRFDFSLAGPISIGALGTLLLLVGLVGLLTRRKP